MLLGSFVGDLLGLEEVGNDVGVLVGNIVTGLFVGDSGGLFVGVSLGFFVGDLLGLEEVGNDDGVLVGFLVTGVGDSLGLYAR